MEPLKAIGSPTTDLTTGLSQKETESRRKQYGYNELAEKKTHPFLRLLARFWGPAAWMLEAIIVLSLWLHKPSDVYIVSGMLVFNALVGFTQEQNAARAVAALQKKLQVRVKLLRDGVWQTEAARELVPGDVIRIRMGDFVPADITLASGGVLVDQSALTGESAAVEKNTGADVYSGSIVSRGEATGVVRTTGKDTYYGKTVELVKTARVRSQVERVIGQVVKWLLLMVGVLLALAFGVSLLRGLSALEVLPLMLVLLLGAIPVALTAMFTVSMALGSKELVRQGVLVTRLNAPDDAASMDVLCVDKTGTLTQNQLSVARLLPAEGFTDEELLRLGTLASQEANRDAIDGVFLRAAKEKGVSLEGYEQTTFVPFDPSTRKTEATITYGQETFRVLKGAFTAIASVCALKEKTAARWQEQMEVLGASGYRTLAVAVAKAGAAPAFAGLVALHDPPRSDAAEIIRELKNLGIPVKMLTGDALPVARDIALVLHLGQGRIVQASELSDRSPEGVKEAARLEQIDGVAEVYPEDKYHLVKALQADGHVVGMTGDGVNDAPALRQADVGIAVSSATDVAKGAASVVLTREGLVNCLALIKVGRMMFRRINIWILNKMARTVLKTCFVVGAYLWLGRFVISATAMLVMIFMTDFVKIALSTDRVRWSPAPARWDIRSLAGEGIILGAVMTIEALGGLYGGLNFFHLDRDPAALSTFCFELLLFFALFSILVMREEGPYWHSAPSRILSVLLLADLILGVVLSTWGFLGFKALPGKPTLAVIGYAAFCSLVVNDWIKVSFFSRRTQQQMN